MHKSTSPGGKYGTGTGIQNGGGFRAVQTINIIFIRMFLFCNVYSL